MGTTKRPISSGLDEDNCGLASSFGRGLTTADWLRRVAVRLEKHFDEEDPDVVLLRELAKEFDL